MLQLSTRRLFLQSAPAAFALLAACGENRSLGKADSAARDLFESLAMIMDGLVSAQKTAGISFGVLRHGHAPLLGQAGVQSIDTHKPVSTETLFRIASVTKTFVAVGVMKLVENNKLALDQSIDVFFPEFPRGDEVTIYQLLSHTSGLKDWWEAGLPSETPGDFVLRPDPYQHLQLAKEPFHFSPGEYHWYSNTGYILLGNIVEKISGERLYDFMDREVFLKAGLRDVFFESAREETPFWAEGHHTSPGTEPPFSLADDVMPPGAAGGIRSTAAGLLQWSQALYNGAVITGETFSKMTTLATLSDGRPVSESDWFPDWMDTAPSPAGFMKDSGWGLGMSLFTANNQKVVWHSGGIPGFNAIWMNFPEQSLSISMLANTDNGVVPAFSQIIPEVVGNS